MATTTSLANAANARLPAVIGSTFANGQVTLTGTSEPGSAILIYEGWTLVGSATAGDDGTWTVTGTANPNAFHAYGVVATDLAGNKTWSASDYVPTATTHDTPVPDTPPDVPTPAGPTTQVLPGDSGAAIQSKLDALQPGGTLVFTGNTTYDFQNTTITGKSGITVWADGTVNIVNAPGAGTNGAFDFSGKSHWTIRGRAPGEGFVFDRSSINATGASHWAVGNSTFNNQASNGYDGSAIRMNGASFGTVINNDFNNAGGNVLGMYNLDNITFDGNHFTDCWQPISIQEPPTADHSLGRNIVITHNVFVGFQRAAIEVGPSMTGAEYFSGLTVDDNFFDATNNIGGPGTLLPISLVGQAAENTTITDNFIRRGPADAGEIGVAIEMAGTGHVSGNTISNFAYAALTYQSGWNVHDNAVYNDGSSPYYGFANNGRGHGTFGPVTTLIEPPATPDQPARTSW